MNVLKNLFFISLIITALFSTSCEKAQNHIYGKICDMTTGEGVENVTVSVYITEISASTYNNNFEKFMTTVTDAEGNYSLEFEPKTVGEYKLKVSKEGYHDNEINFMPEETASEYKKDVTIPKAGYIKYKILNAYGVTSGDENDAARIKIDGINPLCSNCCSSDYMIFEGLDVNIEGVWNIVAGEEITITRYLIRKGEQLGFRIKNYICEQGDTIEYNWTY